MGKTHARAPSGTGRMILCEPPPEYNAVGDSTSNDPKKVSCPACQGILAANRSLNELGGTTLQPPQEPLQASQRQEGGSHYLDMELQPWEVFERRYGPAKFGWYLILTAQHYLLRAGDKGPLLEDIRKARHCLEKAEEVLND